MRSGRLCCGDHSHFFSAKHISSTIDPARAPVAYTAVPEPSPHKSPPTPSPPSAKRTRKAVKRRCEVELLRGVGVEDDIYVPPPLLTPPPARSPQPPSPALTPTTSLVAELSHFLADPPQLPTIQPVSTRDHSAPAPSAISSPPTPPEPAPSTTLAPMTTSGPSSAPPLTAPAESSPTPTSLTLAPMTTSGPLSALPMPLQNHRPRRHRRPSPNRPLRLHGCWATFFRLILIELFAATAVKDIITTNGIVTVIYAIRKKVSPNTL
jgi:hypothetical protein